MRNLSLTVKIWLAISLVSLLLYLFVLIVTPFLIRNFFTNNMLEQPSGPLKNKVEELVNDRGFHIRSFILLDDGTTLPSKARQAFQPSFLNEIKRNAESQQQSNKLYESKNGQTPIRYVIVKDLAYGRPLYQIMFLRKPEEDRFVREFLFNIMLFVGLALVVSWFVSLLIVRYLTRPLTIMEQHVKRIANRNWHEPLDIKRNDEIGKLANSIDSMRQQLIQQDETQQSMLQNISHELKTPVMVIRSYAQAIQDGVYPKGDLNGSIEVIDEEGERLEKLIKQLLYLTRLDYLATKNQQQDEVQLDKLIEKTVQCLHLQRPAITLQLNLQPVTVMGDEETLRVMIENLFDNHLRYARSQIKINLAVNSEKTEAALSFWNDGAQIAPQILNEVFKPFQKGREGKYGLGLTIVQRILKMYHGDIVLKNERDGVSSIVKMHLKLPEL
ncbi:integral membrane sensor signal transduction histidine kinase [Desulfotomaculum nigrificans CO-1-SRB]|uniref:histidine kinase n=1 Tax=Desulfotomaculum nigrificans (strain DSM 14880 / VKM B-2319 / CO-1-SRB) TaxID=868595 RepID=F6B6V5_DESCC|nr:HAMP domain-containing sensor histidine kinase [Desulfotomaculum nigrificans]AEF93280.1 integral membrane sensor signal transduction histidine kinase [Desulfotomaculum nigrificans CO-1-SRB]